MIRYIRSHLAGQLLVVFFIVAVLPTLILWLISSAQFSNQYEAQVKNQLRSLVGIQAAQFRSLVQASEFALNHSITDQALENRLVSVLTIPGDWGSVVTILRRTLQQEIRENQFSQIDIYDLDSNLILSTNTAIEGNQIPAMLHSEATTVMNLGTPQQPILMVSIAIRNRDSNPVGYLAGMVNPVALNQILFGDTGFEELSSMLIINPSGNGLVPDLSDCQVATCITIISGANAEKTFQAVGNLSDLNAQILMQLPYASAMQAPINLQNAIIGVTIFAGLVSIGLGALVTRNLTHPLTRLTQIANQIRQGDFTQRVASVHENEFGQLGMAFDEMTDRTQQLLQSLQLRESELEAALLHQKELLDLQSHFIRQTSHEFRTPIAVISAAAQSLQKFYDQMAPEQRQIRFERISGQVKHMTSMLDDVLLIKKIEEGEFSLSLERFSFGELLREIISEFETIELKHSLNCIWAAGDFEITADKKLIRQVVNNLISNAIKYSPDHTMIWITLDEVNHNARLMVKDQGIGIPSEHQEKIFSAFQRAKNVGNIKGTGLGLSITRRAIEMHNGTINFSSVEGNGTTFVVELPLS